MRECVFGVGELKYTIEIYKESKGVAMATKFMYKSVTIALISVQFSSVQTLLAIVEDILVCAVLAHVAH